MVQWDLERGFYWSVTFSSPRAELLPVVVLILIRTTLYFGCTTVSAVTYVTDFSLYVFTLLEN